MQPMKAPFYALIVVFASLAMWKNDRTIGEDIEQNLMQSNRWMRLWCRKGVEDKDIAMSVQDFAGLD